MTNAEKFEEVFGLKLDVYPDDICNNIISNVCMDHSCCDEDCPAFKFWEREYKDDGTKNN